MSRLYQKMSFLLELFINGAFIFLYSFHSAEKYDKTLISTELVEYVLNLFTYAAPVIVLISAIAFFLKSENEDEFLRKYIFSIICVVPMFITWGNLQFAFWLAAVHLFSSILSLYETTGEQVRHKVKKIKKASSLLERIKLAPGQIVILSFVAIILVGTLLLSLPISAAEGKNISFIDAFFMATSATCVTGLSTVSVPENFSFIGQIILLVLIQIGGLGYMTLYSSMTILLGKSLAVRDQVMMQDLLDISSLEDLLQMIINIVRYTLVIELIGAVILSISFSLAGHEFGESLYMGIFHSVSAFCNAGFALFDNSLENFALNPFVHGTVSALIFLGGLGFIVLKELEYLFLKGGKVINLTVHTKVVLVTNLTLIGLVAAYIFFGEFLHGLDQYGLWEKVQISVFQSITTRTAGFNTIAMSSLHPHTIYLMCLVMFIGASPGSTGGGIKTTTFAILFQSVKATLKGRDKVDFFDRTVPNIIVVRAVAIIIISLMIVSSFILVMMKIEPEHDFLSVFFEVVSAFSTVGLSLGITPYLSVAGKLVLSLLMLVGRVGPLTLALAVGKNKKDDVSLKYPKGRIMIG
jgi:trk system potassium uptake protein